jgi:beta-glucanase (GH16 family)
MRHTSLHLATIALAAAALACDSSGGSQAQGGDPGSDPGVPSVALHDGFDAFDPSVWSMAHWANGSPFNCGFLADHVTFSDGAMTLRLDDVASAGKPYSGGEYRTNDTFGYGRFEARMRAARGSGIVSSFFVYTGSPWDEVDVEVLGKNTTQVQFNYFSGGIGGHEHVVDLGFDAAEDFHTYAFDWSPGAIRWYVDGKLEHTVTGGGLPTHRAQIMMNLWNGIGVDNWLGPFGYSGPVQASYDEVTYTPASSGAAAEASPAGLAEPLAR